MESRGTILNFSCQNEYSMIQQVLMGNSASCKITGIGIKLLDEVVRTSSNVRYVPNLKKNMISLSILYSNGYRYISEGRVLKIRKMSLLL